MAKEWEGRGEREEGFYICVPGGRRDRMECLDCWGLVSMGGKAESFPAASFHYIPVQFFLLGIVS